MKQPPKRHETADQDLKGIANDQFLGEEFLELTRDVYKIASRVPGFEDSVSAFQHLTLFDPKVHDSRGFTLGLSIYWDVCGLIGIPKDVRYQVLHEKAQENAKPTGS